MSRKKTTWLDYFSIAVKRPNNTSKKFKQCNYEFHSTQHSVLFISVLKLRFEENRHRFLFNSTLQRFRQLFCHSRHLVMVATPTRIQSGMFHWLERCVSGNAGGVDGPPMAALTIVLPDMHDKDYKSYCQGYELRHQTEFLSAVQMAVAAIPAVKLIIGQHVPLSLLADWMQTKACGKGLFLDLSDWVVRDLTAPIWATLVQLSGLQLKLHGGDMYDDDNVVLGMVCAIEASLATDHPVAWREVGLGFARNSITDTGLTSMIRSLGRCPQLVQLKLDLTESQRIQNPEKLDRLVGALGHIPSLHIKLGVFSYFDAYPPLKPTSDDIAMPDVRTFSLSLLHHQIFPGALRIPHQLVELCLHINETQLMGIAYNELAGFRQLGQALTATAATLQILELGMAGCRMQDSTFVCFCSVGVAPLIRLRRLSLDVTMNQLTDIGVDALQHVLSPTIQHLEWRLGFNLDVRRVHLHTAPCLRTVILKLCTPNMVHIQLPVQVVHLTVALGTGAPSKGCDMCITGVDAVQRLTLHLNCNTVFTLKHITEKHGAMKMDLRLDLSKITNACMDHVLKSIARFGKAGMLEKLEVSISGRQTRVIKSPGCLASVLSICRTLVSLRVEMSSAFGLCEILSSVGRDLVHLVDFALMWHRVKGSTAIIDAQTVAPCTLFAREVLRDVFLNFYENDLTDESVALMVRVAVQRSTDNHKNRTTLKVEGSSVGVHALNALSTATALLGCKFTFFNSKPMSPLVSLYQHMHNPIMNAQCERD